MKKDGGKRIIYVLLAIMLFFTSAAGGASSLAMEEEELPLSSTYLYPFEEAIEELNQLVKKQEIPAAVFLEDSLYLRMLPEEESEPLIEVASGDVVSIKGAGQDSSYNIWYLVEYGTEQEKMQGYIPKKNLACVVEEFLLWEENYVRSIGTYSLRKVSYDFSDVESFPQSYQESLKQLKEKHPNWIFVKMNTGIEWETLINSQKGERSLIYGPTSPENWKEGNYGTTKWAYASERIIKYFIDPRNWLSEKNIFQFELLGYSPEYHTVNSVKTLLKNSFMENGLLENNKTYAETFVDLGQTTNVSPFLMATRIYQEQGRSGSSALISGTYKGYEGFYNYYNIGASGKTEEEVIISGLTKAKTEGWNSRVKSLAAGATFLGGSYIKAGQDTLYLQKFDVDHRNNGIFWHQYMQNIQAPTTEAAKVQQAYSNSGLMEEAFIFRIPVYENMPSSASVLPGKEDKISLSSSEITDLQIGSEITLRAYINEKEAEGMEWSFSSSDDSIVSVNDEGVIKGLQAGSAIITCRKKEDMSNTLEGICRVTVVKAKLDLDSLEIPKLDSVVYDPDRTLSDIELPEGYQWINPEMVPTVSQEKYGVQYNPDKEKYDTVSFDIVLVVKKAVPQYEIPKDLQGGAGRELQSVVLPQGFWWQNPEEILASKVGVYEYKANYNPDSLNYENAEGIVLTVKTVCEVHDFDSWEIEEATCDEKGLKKRECKICGETEELVLEPTGHHYVIKEEVAATQMQEGLRTYFCDLCKDSYEETIPKLPSTHVHKYEKNIIKKASCTQEGVAEYTCECKDTYQEYLEATGHQMEQGSCISCGYKEQLPEQPKEENKTEENQNPSKEEKPSQEEKPTESQKPSEEEKPAESQKPSGEEKPTESQKPSQEEKPAESQKPSGEEKPAESQKPSGEAKPAESQKPSEEQKSELQVEGPLKEREENTDQYVEVDLLSLLVENTKEENKEDKKTEENIVLQLNKNTEVSENIIKMAKNYGVDLVISLPNGMSWIIPAATIGENIGEKLNMGAQIANDIIPSGLIEKINSKEYLELKLEHEGEFGFEATLNLQTEKENFGKIATLYYYDPIKEQLEYIMETKVEEEGNVLLKFQHASDYLLTFSDKTMEDKIIRENVEESKEIVSVEEKNSTAGKSFSIVVVILVIVAVAMILAGLAMYFRGKEMYYDEDVDDYREKEETEVALSTEKRSHKEEEYFDEDVDDYQEKM